MFAAKDLAEWPQDTRRQWAGVRRGGILDDIPNVGSDLERSDGAVEGGTMLTSTATTECDGSQKSSHRNRRESGEHSD